MKLFYSATSPSFAQTLLVALDEADIPYHYSSADTSIAGQGGIANAGGRIYLHREEDLAQATAILQTLLGPTTNAGTLSPRLLLWFGIAAAVISVGTLVANG